MTIKTRLNKLELQVQPGQPETIVHYIRAAGVFEDLTPAAWQAGQAAGKYPPESELIKVICEPDPGWKK
jgi:hypothetical protein